MNIRKTVAAVSALVLFGIVASLTAQTRTAPRKPVPAKAPAKPVAAAEPASTPNARPEAPKLILLLVVDQFRADYLDRFHTEYKGGLKRLLDESAVFGDAHYDHSPTVTAVGHSITLTGAMPSSSGIVGNEWYDRATGKQVTSVNDPSTK